MNITDTEYSCSRICNRDDDSWYIDIINEGLVVKWMLVVDDTLIGHLTSKVLHTVVLGDTLVIKICCYGINNEYRNNGYMTKMMLVMLSHLHEVLSHMRGIDNSILIIDNNVDHSVPGVKMNKEQLNRWLNKMGFTMYKGYMYYAHEHNEYIDTSLP